MRQWLTAVMMVALGCVGASSVAAQTAAGDATQPAAVLPPPGSGPLVRTIQIAFPAQGNVSMVEPQTYLYYIQTRPSRPSEGVWVPYDEASVLADFQRLWATNFLDDLSIEVNDAPYDNGVVGKHIIYNLEERERIRLVNYNGSKALERTKIEEQLTEKSAQIRLDSFADPGVIRRVEGVLREMLAEKGHDFAEVTHEIRPAAGGPKIVTLVFNIVDGPKVKVRDIEFVGNTAMGDGTLKRKMKNTKEHWWLSFLTGRGTYQATKFEEDADRLVQHYRNEGYVSAQIGQPEMEFLDDSEDGETRWVQLRIPVQEGARFRVGQFDFEGNTIVQAEALRPLFKVKSGDFYSEKDIRKGLEKTQELYGAGGYFEFTGFPDLKPQEEDPADPRERRAAGSAPTVDVTMRLQEGDQYFVNRISFSGNTTTHDTVIRREMRLYEGGVFNTQALKNSVLRVNQLGYFQNVEPEQVKVEKTPGMKGHVDVGMDLVEQNRNQITFGAGVSQWDGFFGTLAFQTANFMGRGETLGVTIQAGSRSKNYQFSFSEPFMFDRAITMGFDVYSREFAFPGQFTQGTTGGQVILGLPVAAFSRMFLRYSYENVSVSELNELFLDPLVLAQNPFLADSLLIGQNGRRTVSKIAPSIVHNTVDHPIFPTRGQRYSASFDYAGPGGNTSFYNPRGEMIVYIPHTRRTSIGFRIMGEFIKPLGSTTELPIFEKLFLGGEYSMRGFDLRSVGPRDPVTGLVLGGNKSLLVNAEYMISVGGPVRLIFFYDAGQVRDRGQDFEFREFKTSTGAEVRFMMPVMNVPFRLIMAYNPQRSGVLNNRLLPTDAFTFRFAVGTTF
jgi:outer membrane protein insertion porin family